MHVCVCVVYYKELANKIMEAEKSEISVVSSMLETKES